MENKSCKTCGQTNCDQMGGYPDCHGYQPAPASTVMTEQHAVEIIMRELGWVRETPEWWRNGTATMREENAFVMCEDLNILVDICNKNHLPINIPPVYRNLRAIQLDAMLTIAEALEGK